MNHQRFLRYVDEVARRGSIRQAAEYLHVAPSAVDRRIHDLEYELGTPIFERLPRGMRLTAAGELFMHYVRESRAELERVRSQIEALKGLRRGKIGLVASQRLAPEFLPRVIAGFRQVHPQVAFDVQIGDHVRALKLLRDYEIDLAVVFNPTAASDIERLAEVELPLMATMRSDHPLAHQPSVKLRDCAGYPIILASPDSGGRQVLSRFLAHKSLQFEPVIVSNNFEFIRGYLLREPAISFQLGHSAVEPAGPVVARPVDERGLPKGSLVLATLRGRQLSVAAMAFAEYCRQVFTASPEAGDSGERC